MFAQTVLGGLMLRLKSTYALVLMILVMGLLARPARAQQNLFYLDRLQISGAPNDGFAVFRPKMYDKTRFYAFGALGVTYNPLRADTVTNSTTAPNIQDPVKAQLITYLVVGTEVANRIGFNIALPILTYASYGDNPTAQQVLENASDKVALHDMRFDARLRAYESDGHTTRLGLGAAIFAPIGNSSGAFAGDALTSSWFFGSGEIDFGKFFIAGNLGPHFRPTHGINGTNGVLAVGNELRWTLGAYVPLRDDRIRLGLELFGSTGLETISNNVSAGEQKTLFSARNTATEWLAQGRFLLDQKGHWATMVGVGTRMTGGYGAPDLRIIASLGYWFTLGDKIPKSGAPRYLVENVDDKVSDRDGDGFPDDIDKCPDIKEDGKPPHPSDGCPADADRDGDGIPDSEDACPDVPEDKDGIQDQDGCPEDDADNDGIPDAQDHCPTTPGHASKIAEKNGCPSLISFKDDGEIQLLEPIQFETAKSTIKQVSYPILDEVVALLSSRKDLKIGVHGHTDSVGSDEMNLQLSKDRAASCVRYLVAKGIAAGRLQSEGFGETKPVATNDTPEGRAKNRRTEFKVIP
jgi:outer membrane protein OmpA-like peptidoglycan-associated protein